MSRPYTLRLTESAESDLAEIWSYIAAEASEDTATRFIQAIETRFDGLRHAPFSGPPRPQLAEGLRVVLVSKYALYYAVSETMIVIVRVLHGARDHAAMAAKGEFSE